MYFGYHWRLPNASKQMERHICTCAVIICTGVCQLIEAVTSSVVIILLLMYYFFTGQCYKWNFLRTEGYERWYHCEHCFHGR